MTHLDLIVSIRSRGAKPNAVFVDLVKIIDTGNDGLSMSGHVVCEIPASESIADIDFRPLRGLRVHVQDLAGDIDRHRLAAKLIAAVEPECLVMPVVDGDSWTIHRRFAGDPVISQTYAL